jgi:hypothetical protein
MTDPDEWIKAFNPEDIEQIEATAKRIIDADTTVYEMSVFMSQADMIEVVKAGVLMQTGDQQAWMTGMAVLMSMISTMIDALQHDGINPFE